VATCPTGIDIRDGLQLECIACTQCADACDSIMARIKKPLGLIRYASQETLEKGVTHGFLRPRVIVYAAILGVILIALFVSAATIERADVTVLRGIGAPFQLQDQLVTNQVRVKVQNRTDKPGRYQIELLDAPGAALVAPEFPLVVPAHGMRTTSLFVRLSPQAFSGGKRAVRFRVRDDAGFDKEIPYGLLGPITPAVTQGERR
jgi:polyferredoxin